MTDFKNGDHVHVEYDGVVKSVHDFQRDNAWELVVVPDGGTAKTYVRSEHVSVIEPEYERGAMYVDADGDYFCYLPDHDIEMGPWYSPGSDMGYGDSYLPRPLRKLVPEGESK